MDFDALFTLILTGFQKASIIALIALGLSLIFGTLGVVNFAHGAIYMVATYFAVYLVNQIGFFAALILVPPIMFILGIAMERGLIRYFYDRPHTDQILVTFGAAIVIQEVLKALFGANNIPFAYPSWGLGPLPLHEYLPFLDSVWFPKWQLLLIVVMLVTAGAIFALLQFTRFGLVVRAGMRDPLMLRFLGINITQKFTLVFGLGALIAGIAGVFGGPVTQVNPEVGMHQLVPSFLVVVIGGMGSLSGALVAALLLGMALSFSADYSAIQQIAIYLVAAIVLLVRPRGLLGQKGVME